LAQVFAIDICAHAVMHNHLHLVLHVDVEQVKNWSTGDVLERWHRLFKGTHLTQQFISYRASHNNLRIIVSSQKAVVASSNQLEMNLLNGGMLLILNSRSFNYSQNDI
jgi:hypothetical protein